MRFLRILPDLRHSANASLPPFPSNSSLMDSNQVIVPDIQEPYSWRVLLVTLAIGIVSFTVLGNSLTIFALFRIKPSASQNSVSNLYIASLAGADLIVGAFVMPFMILYSVANDYRWPLGGAFCDVWQAVDFISCTISLYSICAIGFDRWWNLEKPLRIFSRNRVLAMKLILIVWLVPIVIWVPTLVSLRQVNGWPDRGACDFDWQPKFLVPVIAIPALYIPVLILIGLFFRITFVIRSHMKFLQTHSNKNNADYLAMCSRNESCRLIDSPVLRNGHLKKRVLSPSETLIRGSRSRRLSTSSAQSRNGALPAPMSPTACTAEYCSPNSIRLISSAPARNGRLGNQGNQNGNSKPIMPLVLREKLAPLKEISIAVSGPSTTAQRSRSPSETDPFLLKPNGVLRKFSATIERSESSSGGSSVVSPNSADGNSKLIHERSPSVEERNSASNRSMDGSSTRGSPNGTIHAQKRTSIISDTAVVFSASRSRILETKPPLLRARTENILEIRTENRAMRRRSARFSIISIREGLINSKRMSINLFSELIPATGISQQIRAAKAVGLLLICFLISWLPFLICWPLKVYCPECVTDTGYSLAIWANYLNSTLNPVLYTLCSPRVQRTLRQYWKRCRTHSKTGVGDTKVTRNRRRP